MLSAVQRRKQNIFYTGNGIQQTPKCIGQLCVSYAIISLLVQKPFTNLPRKTLVHTVEKREEMRHQPQNDRIDCNREDMTKNVINCATKEATQYLHRTRDPANPHKHRATVCIICNRFIIGTETIHKLTKEDIGAHHSGRLGIKSYKEFYQTTLKEEVKRQYQVQGLQDMLLSPRSRKYPDGYATCFVCYTGMQPQMAYKKTPPKFAIANGFVIGSLMPNEQRMKFHPSSNFSETYSSNTPKCNV